MRRTEPAKRTTVLLAALAFLIPTPGESEEDAVVRPCDELGRSVEKPDREARRRTSSPTRSRSACPSVPATFGGLVDSNEQAAAA
jgi:hypothetical protein